MTSLVVASIPVHDRRAEPTVATIAYLRRQINPADQVMAHVNSTAAASLEDGIRLRHWVEQKACLCASGAN